MKTFTSPSSASVAEAAQWILANRDEGVLCPCCAQLCKTYKRTINSTMARALILIYHHFVAHPELEWLHLPDFLVRHQRQSTIAGGDVAKLRFWELIERRPGEREDGSDRLGYYRVTNHGRRFVLGTATAPKYILIYNQTPLGMSEERVTIHQALGKRFDYNELMRG